MTKQCIKILIKADSDLISASLTHGPRVVAADAAGAEALVGVLKIIKGAIMIKPGSRPGGRWKCGTPFGGCATTFPPLSSAGRPKGKRLNGQARRLTSPDLHILCRMCTVSLWVLTNVPHESTGKRRVVYSAP